VAAQTPANSGVIIPSPENWVAFDAVGEQRNTTGSLYAHVKHYQNADGSTRRESGADPDRPDLITISNVPLARYFMFIRGSWTSHPMYPPADGYRPLKRLTGTSGLDRAPATVPVAGFEVYRQILQPRTGDIETVRYVVPALNFFEVKSEASNGSRHEYFGVVVRPQPADLFTPPPGATVEIRSEPMGIISQKEAAAAGVDLAKAQEDLLKSLRTR
jgi:hypothetical protein